LLVLEVGYYCNGDVRTADGAVDGPAWPQQCSSQHPPVSAASFQKVYSSVVTCSNRILLQRLKQAARETELQQ